jgi:2-polyprenyl-3-methyl-5-hydroxy-6-metoxy-1,4-benzoquinol methylase
MQDDIRTLLTLIDPSVDWSTKDVSHLAGVKVLLNTVKRDHLLAAIKSTYWPEAVPPAMIIKNVDDRRKRANSIVTDFVRTPLLGKRFLDFGCGTGECVDAAHHKGAKAVGFEIVHSQEWAGPKGTFTTDLDEALSHGPYEVMLLYDVVDHMFAQAKEFRQVAAKLRQALAPGGTAYVRCHPFSSRHGGHAYETFNKAYAHLYLTHDELVSVGVTPDSSLYKIVHPMRVYPALFSNQQFVVQHVTPVTVRPERVIEATIPFIQHHWNTPGKTEYNINPQGILDILAIQFVDLQLTTR